MTASIDTRMDVVVVTTAKTDAEAKPPQSFDMPFAN